MERPRYVPSLGDIIKLDFGPTVGREQSGYRPALIINDAEYFRLTRMLIVLPISNTQKTFPLHIKLEEGLQTTGVVLAQHIRTIDPVGRSITFVEPTSINFTKYVLEVIALYFTEFASKEE
ncbi:MAG: type II toxin-antitoxin system PemK/MazF family toxin [Defluviitaleaceae bacterium]|nr:type II toxin-antitoxin system PemK/MazF family toxin [Defluviitaleaceae bacterium]